MGDTVEWVFERISMDNLSYEIDILSEVITPLGNHDALDFRDAVAMTNSSPPNSVSPDDGDSIYMLDVDAPTPTLLTVGRALSRASANQATLPLSRAVHAKAKSA